MGVVFENPKQDAISYILLLSPGVSNIQHYLPLTCFAPPVYMSGDQGPALPRSYQSSGHWQASHRPLNKAANHLHDYSWDYKSRRFAISRLTMHVIQHPWEYHERRLCSAGSER